MFDPDPEVPSTTGEAATVADTVAAGAIVPAGGPAAVSCCAEAGYGRGCEHLTAWLAGDRAGDGDPEASTAPGWDVDAAEVTDEPAEYAGLSLRELELVSTLAPVPAPGRVGPLGEDLPAGLLAAMTPDAGLAAVLDGVDVDAVDAFTAVEVIAALRRVEAWAGAGAALAAARLAAKPEMSSAGHPANPAGTVLNGTAEELAMRLGLTRGEGARLVQVGQGLATTFTDTARAVRAGEIDLRKATTIVTTLWDYPEPVAWCAEQEVLAGAGGRTGNQLARDLARVLIAVDPDEAARRHQKALRRQHVTHPRALPDGMSAMYVVGGAEDTVPLDVVLTACAQAAKAAGDRRSTDVLRAEALFTLAAGALATGWVGSPPDPTGPCSCTATDHHHPGIPGLEQGATGAGADAGAGGGGGHDDRGERDGLGDSADDGVAEGSALPAGVGESAAGGDGDPDGIDRDTGTQSTDHDGNGGGGADGRPATAGAPAVGADANLSPGAAVSGSPPDLPPGPGVPPDAGGGPPGEDDQRCGDESCSCTGTLGDDRLPPLHLLVHPRPGRALGAAASNRTQVRLTLPLSVALPPVPAGAAGAPCYDVPSGEVADLAGYGPVDPDVARAIALGGTWRRVVTDPLSGAVLDVGRTRYKPPAELAEHVRQRDRTCVSPLCTVPADRCQLDHTLSWSLGGETADHNLDCLCKRDHQLKSCGLFHVTQPQPGVFDWVTPSGHAYRRAIDGTITPMPRPGAHGTPPF